MLNTALGFSLFVSITITSVVYIVCRDKNKSEQEQKDKLNDMIILFIICFVIIVVGKIMISGSNTSTMSTAKVVESKGGQCPF